MVPNGIQFERIRSLAAESDANAPPLVYAGRLIPEKQIDLLLDATARLAATGTGRGLATERGALLRIIGGGPAENDIRAHIEREKLAGVVDFAGRLPENEDVWHCKSPNSAVSELVRDDREGWAVDPHAGELASLLERLLDAPAAVAAASRAAVERAAGYDWRQVAARVIEAGNDLVRRERS